MKKDFSPEEKLLRLIRGSKKKGPKEEKAEVRPPVISEQPVATPVLPRPTVGAKAISIPSPFDPRMFNMRNLNILLIIFLAGLLLYFVIDLAYTTYYGRYEPTLFIDEAFDLSGVEEAGKVEIKPLDHYMSAIRGRNIFTPQFVETETVVSGPSINEVSGSLSLIGIIAGEKPQAIIEDKKTGRSYFLNVGQTIGPSTVVEIMENSVVLEYQGQQFKLFL